MKTEKEIRAKLAEVEAYERLHSPTAKVEVNAPLALIQVDLETRQHALRWCLDEKP